MGRAKKRNKDLLSSDLDLQEVDSQSMTQALDGAAGQKDVHCQTCEKELPEGRKALYVEEEIGRVFCSEECILAQFQPEITQYEDDYFSNVSSKELTPEEREELLPLRWGVLKHPDEIWREKSTDGDHRYCLISEFDNDGEPLWVFCITLFLRGDPSFLFLAAVTRDKKLIARYRKGDRIHWNTPSKKSVQTELEQFYDQAEDQEVIDGLADEWTTEDSLRAELRKEEGLIEETQEDDALVETTLESPDEVWVVQSTETMSDTPRFYHFIKRLEQEKISNSQEAESWSVIVAQEGENIDEIEIIECFTTQNSELVERFRQGTQELGSLGETQTQSRFIH